MYWAYVNFSVWVICAGPRDETSTWNPTWQTMNDVSRPARTCVTLTSKKLTCGKCQRTVSIKHTQYVSFGREKRALTIPWSRTLGAWPWHHDSGSVVSFTRMMVPRRFPNKQINNFTNTRTKTSRPGRVRYKTRQIYIPPTRPISVEEYGRSSNHKRTSQLTCITPMAMSPFHRQTHSLTRDACMQASKHNNVLTTRPTKAFSRENIMY